MRGSDRLFALLDEAGAAYEVIEHPEATTAGEAAAARGTALADGGKSVVLKADRIGLVVLAVGSDRRVEGRLLRRALGIQRYRFLSPAELREATGLDPGEVPPFGRPVIEATLYCGEDFLRRDTIVFAAGSRTRSVRMSRAEWQRVAAPRVVAGFTGEMSQR